MSNKPILIVAGEPNSIFSEILYKAFKRFSKKKPLILFASHDLLIEQFKKLKISTKLNLIDSKKPTKSKLKKEYINLYNIDYSFSKPFEKISKKSNIYIKKCFDSALHYAKKNKISGIINGPVSKKYFLKNKHLGITEYLSKKYNLKQNYSMLIYGKEISVSTITTHLPISLVSKSINKESIIIKTFLINSFYKKKLNKTPKIAITGLNPHCENFLSKSEEEKIIKPAIKYLLKKKINIKGPYPADTIFMDQNIKNFDVIIGMYHDQVLTPLKTLYEYDAINITLGLPFDRISPDHGPNKKMLGRNISNPLSLIRAIQFLERN